jgi:hypothetical protein
MRSEWSVLLNFDLARFAFKTAQKSPTIEGFGDCTALAQKVHDWYRAETSKEQFFQPPSTFRST